MSLTKVSFSMIHGSYVNVIDYGADPTNVSDSTLAIQLALDTGKTVFIPDGTYTVTSTLKIYSNQALICSPGATIEGIAINIGTDPNTTQFGIRSGVPRGFPIITNDDYVNGNENIIIEGGNWVFKRNITIRAGAIVQLINVANGNVKNIFGSCDGQGLYTQNAGAIFAFDCEDISILDCTVDTSIGCNSFYVYECPRTKIIGCFAQTTNDTTYQIRESPFSTVENCYAHDSAGSHIGFNSTDGIISNNYIDMGGANSVIVGASMGVTVGHPTSILSGSRTKVIGNTIVNNQVGFNIFVQQAPATSNVVISGNTCTGANGSTGRGIQIDGSNTSIVGNDVSKCLQGIFLYGEDNLVIGNQVYLNQEEGIRVESSGNNICGNSVYDNGTGGSVQRGIAVTTLLGNFNVISGNVCYNNASPKTQEVGISIGTGLVGNVVVGNISITHDTADIIIVSAGNIYQNNMLGTSSVLSPVQQLTQLDDTGTPSVLNVSPVCNTGGTTTITNLLNGFNGQQVTIFSAHNVTVQNNANINLNGAIDFTMTTDDTLTLIRRSDRWYEIGRSIN